MIIANNLYKEYILKRGILKKKYDKKIAVNDVSLNIKKGSIVGLLGVNGAGKTTTIKMLTTMLSPTHGSILIDEVNAIDKHMEAKKKINLITGGERNIYWRLSAKENLNYFGSLYGLSKIDLNNQVEKVLKIVDLEDVKDIPVEKYSKGMKQRLQIARGLINNPDYLFMDEPTLGLDIMITKSIHEYIKKLAHEENKGILITTHYIHEAEDICDYIYVIDHGRIIAEGTSEQIKELYTHKQVYNIKTTELEENQINAIQRIYDGKAEVKLANDMDGLNIKADNLDFNEIMEVLNINNIKIESIGKSEFTLEDALYEMLEGVS
ncbi:ABC-2 type transport system ATP-binding protein [Pseudobutyrivibrio sp. UC1225]|uniref:ABC transporter ATP-binding protein n=1 Tax=Pseudobutyrivibrio sp. UC1225 TaxID=1798185 RepID=UPI0008E79548|nr:ABC transporter ATP-binding protein [Pseudobutyrivibrio sp. UC1225]SFO30754.1 ABC-2 type transport system ATP-binding protein [Pseudobutyrivibrio sp. UC1225]